MKYSGPVRDRAAFVLTSQLDLLRDAECIVDLDAEIADSAFELRMPEQQLHRS